MKSKTEKFLEEIKPKLCEECEETTKLYEYSLCSACKYNQDLFNLLQGYAIASNKTQILAIRAQDELALFEHWADIEEKEPIY